MEHTAQQAYPLEKPICPATPAIVGPFATDMIGDPTINYEVSGLPPLVM